ncbi:MAG TPA: ParB/RepB/Spo0J family partition protein [Candidatus Paceibacterota bacterium]
MSEDKTNSGEVVLISIDDISPSPYQPRTYFDEVKLDELAASIKEKGVLQPITVRPVEGKAMPYELVMGERRWRASRKAGISAIRSLIEDLSDEEAREIALIENLQRDDLTPMDEARSILSLVEVYEGNKAAAARKIGKPDQYVYQALELLTLPKEVQDLLESRELNVAQARVLLEVEGDDKKIHGAMLAQRLGLSANQLRGRLQQHIAKKRGGNSESSERKATTFKRLSSSLVTVYEDLEGFDFDELGGNEKGLKDREMLRKQVALVRQSLARAETALLRDPSPQSTDEKKSSRPPRLSAG